MTKKINVMDYVYIVSAKKLKGSGLERGQIMLVTGTKSVPASTRDTYLTRELVVTIQVTQAGEHLVPKQNNEYRAYLIDPRNLSKVDEEMSEFLSTKLKEQYGATSN
jgi:hypothetical protein